VKFRSAVAVLGLATIGTSAGCHQAKPGSCSYPQQGRRVARLSLLQQVPPGIFAGVVIDSATKLPIAGTEVSLPALHIGTVTDSLGAFRLRNLPYGKHAVLVRRIGYYAVSDTVLISDSAGVAAVYDLALDLRGVCQVYTVSSASRVQPDRSLRLHETWPPPPPGTRLAIQFNKEPPIVQVSDGRGGPPLLYHGQQLNPNQLKSIIFLKMNDARQRFGDQTLDGALLIELK
jgi:hypothetical protein